MAGRGWAGGGAGGLPYTLVMGLVSLYGEKGERYLTDIEKKGVKALALSAEAPLSARLSAPPRPCGNATAAVRHATSPPRALTALFSLWVR